MVRYNKNKVLLFDLQCCHLYCELGRTSTASGDEAGWLRVTLPLTFLHDYNSTKTQGNSIFVANGPKYDGFKNGYLI